MSRMTVKYTIAAAPLLFLLALSCSRHGGNVNDPLSAAEIDPVLEQSFQSADATVRAAVHKIVEETQQNQVAAAFTDMKELASMPNLTDEQRVTAIRAAKTLGQELQEAAQKGDQQASETLQSYKASH